MNNILSEAYGLFEYNPENGEHELISVGFDELSVNDELDLLDAREQLMDEIYVGRYNAFLHVYLNNNPYPEITKDNNEWEDNFNIAFKDTFKSLGLPDRIDTYKDLYKRLENFSKKEYDYTMVPILKIKDKHIKNIN